MSGGRGLKVLLIDDSIIVLRALKRLLKKDDRVGHLFIAPNAADGYSLFKISRPDAVVLDLDLPDLHGLEILKRIKSDSPKCVVIILTNSSAPEMCEASLRNGADSFLNKESDLAAVRETLFAIYESRCRRLASGERRPERCGGAGHSK